MPSVTELVKAISGASEGLVEWANRVGLEGKTLDEARSPKRDAGNRLHAELERLVRGEPLADPADDAVVALASWWSEASEGATDAWAERPLRVVAYGVEVWGRADVMTRSHRDHVSSGGTLPVEWQVWDAKVGKRPYVGIDNVFQVGIYQAIVALTNTETGLLPIVSGGVLRLSEDGALRVVESPWRAADAIKFLADAAAIWRRQQEARAAASGWVR